MGGLLSEEFQALAPIGEDTLVLCDSCDFASNIEVAQTIPSQKEKEEEKELEKVETPHCSSIEEVRASAIDFDGSVFYFPDLANKKIYTKQINLDGTASINMYELKEMPIPTT